MESPKEPEKGAAVPANGSGVDSLKVKMVPVASLKPHPRNYRGHPDDQLQHLVESLKEHKVYRNIVCARDGTILAGHGVWYAAQKAGLLEIPVVKMDLDPNEPRALKLMVADNSIEHLADQDDRGLQDLLKEIKSTDIVGLLGTG